MKRYIRRAVLLLALLLFVSFVCGLVYGVWQQGSVPLTVSQWEETLDSDKDVMRVRLECFTGGEMTGLQSIQTVNRSGAALSQIVLRAYANGAEAVGMGARAVDVKSVYVNDEAVPFAFDEDDPTVLRIEYAWRDGEEIKLRWHVSAPVAGSGVTLITLPVLGVLEDGVWRTDAWDPLVQGGYADAFDWEIWMEYNDCDVAFGGALLGYGDDPSGRIAQARMSGARDVTLLMTKGQAIRYREIGGVKVAAAAKNALAADSLLDDCEAALESLDKAGFAYPFPVLTVAQTAVGYEDGIAATAFAALGEEKDGEARLRRLTRLIARQTFGVLVGNDAWREPWLSQSLSSAAELLAYRARKGEKAYETRFFEDIEVATRLTRPYGVTVGADVMRFGSDDEMTQVLRDQGAAMLLGLREAMGAEEFIEALHFYVKENAFAIASRQALESALETVSGSSWSGYLEDELSF